MPTTIELLAFVSLAGSLFIGIQPAAGSPSGEADATVAIPSMLADVVPSDGPLSLQVDFGRPLGPIPAHLYSIAGFSAPDPAVSSQSSYLRGLEYLGCGMIRIHHAKLTEPSSTHKAGWLNETARGWDRSKVIAAIKPLRTQGLEVVLCIPDWPPWLREPGDRALAEKHLEEFAGFCANLVQLVNGEGKLGVRYFEITNERDTVYWLPQIKAGRPTRVADLARIHRACAHAMKQVDPTIRVGGPAAARSDLIGPLRHYVEACGDSLDFLSFHAYASGDPRESDESILGKTQLLGQYARDVVSMLRQVSPNRHIEAHLNEFNISWTWKTRDARMVDQTGAVFDALALLEGLRSDLDMTAAWNDRDDIYGKMDSAFHLRPSAHVYHLFNHLARGERCVVSPNADSFLSAEATRTTKGSSLILVNWGTHALTVHVNGLESAPDSRSDQPWNWHRVQEGSISSRLLSTASPETTMELPPRSVHFLTTIALQETPTR